MCSVYQLCQQAAVLVVEKKRENILFILCPDPENKIILGMAQAGNIVDINQALPQPEAPFCVSAVVVV